MFPPCSPCLLHSFDLAVPGLVFAYFVWWLNTLFWTELPLPLILRLGPILPCLIPLWQKQTFTLPTPVSQKQFSKTIPLWVKQLQKGNMYSGRPYSICKQFCHIALFYLHVLTGHRLHRACFPSLYVYSLYILFFIVLFIFLRNSGNNYLPQIARFLLEVIKII